MEINWSQESYLKAYRFAAEAHRNQNYPGTDLPYLLHISFVSMEIIASLNYGTNLDGDFAVQCALLHDVIEDTHITYDDVENSFGIKMADGVLALTKDFSLAEKERIPDSLVRIKEQPYEVWMVKLADRISNLAIPPDNWDQEKTKQYWLESRKILNALIQSSDYLSQRLQMKIDNYQKFL